MREYQKVEREGFVSDLNHGHNKILYFATKKLETMAQSGRVLSQSVYKDYLAFKDNFELVRISNKIYEKELRRTPKTFFHQTRALDIMNNFFELFKKGK